MGNKDNTGFATLSYIYSGAGIGLLVGLLLGLSISPVIGSVVAGLTALLAAFFGLTESKSVSQATEVIERIQRQSRLMALRIGSFGFACIIGVFLGVFVRANDLLSASYADKKEAWTKIGIEDSLANQLIVFHELGISPDNWKIDPAAIENTLKDDVILFETKGVNCNDMSIERYADVIERIFANADLALLKVDNAPQMPILNISNIHIQNMNTKLSSAIPRQLRQLPRHQKKSLQAVYFK
ncbi:MAG: hypothetical protein ACM3S2_20235 [Ignavibacteriales bacterium]